MPMRNGKIPYIVTIDGVRRLVSAVNEDEAAMICTDRWEALPDAIEVAAFYTGSIDATK